MHELEDVPFQAKLGGDPALPYADAPVEKGATPSSSLKDPLAGLVLFKVAYHIYYFAF